MAKFGIIIRTAKPLRGAALLRVGVVICAVALAGCQSPHRAPEKLTDDPLWQGQAVHDLAFDLRCDGQFDFEAECAGLATQDRLRELSTVPTDILQPLKNEARELNKRWHGQ